MGFRTAPAQNTGYYRASDWPTSKGSGPMPSSGPTVSPGQNGAASAAGWHPTVLWMLGFVIVELVAFNLLAKYLNI